MHWKCNHWNLVLEMNGHRVMGNGSQPLWSIYIRTPLRVWEDRVNDTASTRDVPHWSWSEGLSSDWSPHGVTSWLVQPSVSPLMAYRWRLLFSMFLPKIKINNRSSSADCGQTESQDHLLSWPLMHPWWPCSAVDELWEQPCDWLLQPRPQRTQWVINYGPSHRPGPTLYTELWNIGYYLPLVGGGNSRSTWGREWVCLWTQVSVEFYHRNREVELHGGRWCKSFCGFW